MLEISVLDSNDNTPSFEKTAYHVSLSERTFPGDMVSVVCLTTKLSPYLGGGGGGGRMEK